MFYGYFRLILFDDGLTDFEEGVIWELLKIVG